MPQKYTTVEGETVDLIAFRERGQTASVTEQILELNPGLSALGPLLPAGLVILIPDPAPKQTIRNVPRIWS